MTATLTSKGQLTLPKEIRERFGLVPGDQVDFEVEPDGEVRVRPVKPKSIESLFGMLERPGAPRVTVEQMQEELIEAVAAEDLRIAREWTRARD